jgi:hypothetical protein
MNLLRSINKLKISNSVRAVFTRWKIEAKNFEDTIPVLFGDGLISINSSAKVNIQNYQAENYGTLLTDGFDLVKKYSLKDGDVFLGRDENYFLFRGGDLNLKTKNLDLNCQEINIECTNINITCPTITMNGVVFTFTGGKLSINGKEVAVIGGDISTITNKITTSGQ